MEPGGPKLHAQDISNNSYPEPNQPNSSYYTYYFFKVHSTTVFSSTSRSF